MDKAKKISALWKQIKPQIGELARLCHEVESHAEVTADAYQRGYENGFVAGHLKAEKSGQSFYEDGYQCGLNDAWECARKISHMDSKTRDEIFDRVITSNIVDENTASEAIEKIRQYEQEKEELFLVGDEVEGDEDGQRGVVIDSRFENSQVAVLTGNSKVYSWWSKCAIHKTGRHFPEIAAVLQKMKESDNG